MIQDFLDSLETMGSSPETVRAYRSDFRGLLAAVGDQASWSDTELSMAKYLNDERKVKSAKTIERRLGTFRSYGRHFDQLILNKYRAPKPAPPQPHPIPEGSDGVLDMIRSTKNPTHRALCALTGLMGLRVGEAIAVRPEDFDLQAMELTVKMGKGSKVRIVPVPKLAWKYMARAFQKAGENGTTLVPLTNRGARKSIKRHGKRAGLSREIASHDMRATCATAAYQRSMDIRAVQEILGHSSVNQTMVYTGISAEAKRAALEV